MADSVYGYGDGIEGSARPTPNGALGHPRSKHDARSFKIVNSFGAGYNLLAFFVLSIITRGAPFSQAELPRYFGDRSAASSRSG
jgi:hypothetical protein